MIHRYNADVWTVQEALSPEECTAFIARGEAMGFEAATVVLKEGPTMATGMRNNDRVTFDDNTLAAQLWGTDASLRSRKHGWIFRNGFESSLSYLSL